MNNQHKLSTTEILEKYKNFKSGLSKEESWEIWHSISGNQELGIKQIDPDNKKLSFRSSDRTPSVSVADRLMAFDFGGSDSKGVDPIDRIIEVTGMPLGKAISLFMSWIGVETVLTATYTDLKTEKEVAQPYKPAYLRRVLLDKRHYKDAYEKIAGGLFRGVTADERSYVERLLHIGYIPASEEYIDRIFVPERDEEGIPWGAYRYNREAAKYKDQNGRPISKGLLRGKAKRVLFGIHLLKKFGKHIIYSEGHTDTIANLAKKYSCITTGAATKGFGENIKSLKGRTLLDFTDLDLAGVFGAMSRHAEILNFNKSAAPEDQIKHIVFWWAEWFHSSDYFDKITNGTVERGDDIAPILDWFVLKNGKAGLNIEGIKAYQKILCQKKKWNFSEFSIDNWKIVFKGQSRQKGYDFIDLYEEGDSEEKSKLLQYLDKTAKH